MSDTICISKEGYTPVYVEKMLACPFCASEPKLNQLYEYTTTNRKGKKERHCTLYSSSIITANLFWVSCENCGCSTGKHESTAQQAVTNWNTRKEPTT